MRRGSDVAASLLAGLALAALAVWVFHGALPLYFSQDDFGGLARAAGLAPRLSLPWRYLSAQAYFDLMRPLAGQDPAPYHLVSLLAHVACTVILFRLLGAVTRPPAAFMGAAWFGVHPTHFTALNWVSAVSDVLAALFSLLTLAAAFSPGRRRWLALPAFATALLCKESCLLLPGVVLILNAWRRTPVGRERRAPYGLIAALGLVALLYVSYLYATNIFGVAAREGRNAAYRLSFGSSLIANLLTYAGWTVTLPLPTARSFVDVADPNLYVIGGIAIAAWLAGLAWSRLRSAGWLAGGAGYLLLLAPVLPLENHTYRYYLYAPLLGGALCVAAVAHVALSRLELVGERQRRKAPTGSRPIGTRWQAAFPWAAAVSVTLLVAWSSAGVVRRMELRPLALAPNLRGDPTVDRARIAANVMESLRAERLDPGVTLLFAARERLLLLMDVAARTPGAVAAPDRDMYWEKNLRAALLDGIAVRVMFPQVDSVGFVREFGPMPPRYRYALYTPDGIARVVGPTVLDSLLQAARKTGGAPGGRS